MTHDDEEFSTDDLKYDCRIHYVIVRVPPDQLPDNDQIGWPVMWAMVDGEPKFYPKPIEGIEVLYDPFSDLPYGFRPIETPS